MELLNHTFTLSFIPHSLSLIKEFPATFSDIYLFMAYWLMVPGWDPLSKKKESWALQPAAASHQFPHPSTCSHQPPWMCSPSDTNWIQQQSLNGKAAFAISPRDRFHLLVLYDVPQAATQGHSHTGWPMVSRLIDILPCVQLPFGKKHQLQLIKTLATLARGSLVLLYPSYLKQPFPGDLLTYSFHRNNNHWNVEWDGLRVSACKPL